MQFFLDESGECSFSSKSNFNHFLITILTVDIQEQKKLKPCIKSFNAQLIRSGWDKTKEIKANEIHRDIRYGSPAIVKILTSLIQIPSLKVSYIIINKNGITHQSFRNAPYGIGYNYFSSLLLSELIFDKGIHDVHLLFDKRNKETHKNKHFIEYLETEIYGTSLERNLPINLLIQGFDSDQCYGLSAVDYFSWSIYRKFEKGEPVFFNLFNNKIIVEIKWYT